MNMASDGIESKPKNGSNQNIELKGKVQDGRLHFICPANGEIFGSLVATEEKEIIAAVDDMKRARKSWSERPIKQRVKALKKLYKHIFEQTDALTLVITRDTGKPRQDALIEVATVLNYLHTIIKHAPAWLKDEKVSTGLQFFKKAYKKHKPRGLVALISPWNYPFTLTMNPLVAALVSGNTLVVKPSEMTPAVGLAMEQLINDIPELAGSVRFIHGDGKAGAQVIEERPDIIYVTGSVNTGQMISQVASKTLTPVICELGGKDPMIVLEKADIQAAARWGCWGAFSNSGQTCMSPERVYVVDAIYEPFVEACLAEAESIKYGYSEDQESEFQYGTITSPRQRDIVKEHIQDALEKGAHLLCGGEPQEMLSPPTILTNLSDDMKVLREETFGAIMPIIRVRDEHEAIELANNSEFGLSASVFSDDANQAKRVAEALEVGSVNVNDTMSHFGIAGLPFGGVKKSGSGRANGPESVLEFTHTVGYVSGKPIKADLATQLRSPGHYKAMRSALQTLMGPTARLKTKGIVKLFDF